MYDTSQRIIPVSSTQIHDLKNRLTVVKGIAQLLGRQLRRADWQHDRIVDRVELLQREIERLEVMLDGATRGNGLRMYDDTSSCPETYTDR
jgi:nitrogen-specific signal transduction histidine kinase